MLERGPGALILALGTLLGALLKPASPGVPLPSPLLSNLTVCEALAPKRPVLYYLVEREGLEYEVGWIFVCFSGGGAVLVPAQL